MRPGANSRSSTIDASPAADTKEASLLFNEESLTGLRREMLRFAVLQLRNRETAEDAVQETFIAAFAAQEKFEHRASVKTWVFSILKHKIIDIMRDSWQKKRIDLPDAAGDDDFDALFLANEHWQRAERPSSWGNPEQVLEDQQFWTVFEICMTKMPEPTARIYSMREFLGLEVEEICKEAGVTPSNCWVILHRARMLLRVCLQQRWFERDTMK